jgi:hypothetical protein
MHTCRGCPYFPKGKFLGNSRHFLGISAKIEQGLVTLTLPKAEHVKPHKITVS